MGLFMLKQDLIDLEQGLFKSCKVSKQKMLKVLCFSIGFIVTFYLIKIFYEH